jgi:hypothetical protein
MSDNYTVKRMGPEFPDLHAWLNERNAEGKLVNVSDDVHALFANATETKDEKGNVVGLKGNGVDVILADASLKDDTNRIKYVQAFPALQATTLEGAVLLLDGRADIQQPEKEGKRAPGSVCSYFNSAYLQTYRNSTIAGIKAELEGPDKALNKAAELIAKVRKISLAEALRIVRGE